MELNSYLFNKFIPEKKFDIHVPGIIINKATRKYGNPKFLLRTVFIFEDIYADLQNAIINEIGKKDAGSLFYLIGRDVGTRYLIAAGAKKIPSFFTSPMIKYIMTGFNANGTSAAKKINYDSGNKILRICGQDNIICRKTKDPSFFAGGFDATLSILLGENLKSKFYCEKCPSCKFEIKPCEQRMPDSNNALLRISSKEKFLNFSQSKNESKTHSFKDLIGFKKISVLKNDKLVFFGEIVMPVEIGLCSITSYHLKKAGLSKIFEISVIASSEKIAHRLISKKKSVANKMNFCENLFCTRGWGIPNISVTNGEVNVRILNPPYTSFGFDYLIFVFNGFINAIFGKKMKCVDRSVNYSPFTLKMKFN